MDLSNILLFILGAITIIVVIFYLAYYFSRDKDNVDVNENQENLFGYLVVEIRGYLRQGKVKEAASVYNRLNHVYNYLDKKKKADTKKTLDELYNEIHAAK